jgi:hypothetical protein
MTQGFFNIANPLFERSQEHLVVKMGYRFSTARTVEIAAHGLREGEKDLAILADEEVILFLVPLPPLEFLQDKGHIFAYCIKDVIDAELP